MKAHKVPATYYSSWNIPGTDHSFYVFYKSGLDKEGQSKSYRKVNNITQEHAFFMEEDFYYLEIKKIPGLLYKLQNEIEEFLREYTHNIQCPDFLDEDSKPDYPIIDIKDYSNFLKCHKFMDSWKIKDADGNNVTIDTFKNELDSYLFNRVGKIIEKQYFANELEPKWNKIKEEIETQRNSGDDFCLIHKSDFLEFFVIQYLRLDDVVIANEINPILDVFRNKFSSLGFDEIELNEMKEDGLLAPESYFYGTLLDVARGDKSKIQNYMDLIERSYVIDLLKAESGISFITSTAPCVIMKEIGTFKAEMVFPVTPQYCIRFVGKTTAGNRNGKFFDIPSTEVKAINQKIASKSKNIVISESKIISDRI